MADQGDKDSPSGEDKLPRSASTRAPSPATPPEDSLRRAHSALGAREAAEGPPGFEGLNLASLRDQHPRGGRADRRPGLSAERTQTWRPWPTRACPWLTLRPP